MVLDDVVYVVGCKATCTIKMSENKLSCLGGGCALLFRSNRALLAINREGEKHKQNSSQQFKQCRVFGKANLSLSCYRLKQFIRL